ncbi:PKD domain-containing protein [Pseudoalteromonas sp. bablab_jr011]|uniref:PKD domain-containing protein n=1 Tax=Pseudoalteromonas sp. bablab_jr011 TaxID=2755062 RepID=UPI0018F758CE|nr:M10 family metallopeptidase C-terminal domain-containing protein [Pseudoalteromonas sp. bablab_jr011]
MSKLKKTILTTCIAALLPVAAFSNANMMTHKYLEDETFPDSEVLQPLLWDMNELQEEVDFGSLRWNYNEDLGTSISLNYAFQSESIGYLSSDVVMQRPFHDYEKEGVKTALNSIEQSVGVTFNEVFSAEDADFIFIVGQVGDGASLPPSNEIDASQMRYIKISGSETLNYFNENLGNEYGIYDNYQEAYASGISTVLHEVGHLLGLKHPFDGNTVLPEEYNNKFYTVMAYNTGCTGTDCFMPTTLKKMDIVTLQYLYGKPVAQKNTGNDIYEYDDAYSYHQLLIDNGGEDTISLENVTKNSVVDLRPTAFSSIIPNPSFNKDEVTNEILGRTFNNFTMDADSQIENVVGGSGDDELIGNDLNNVIEGGAGNDTIRASLGDDEYYGDSGFDTVIYEGKYADYDMVENLDYITITSKTGAQFTHKLMSIESIQFSDHSTSIGQEIQFSSGSDVTLESNLVSSTGESLNWAWLQIDGYDVETTGDNSSTLTFIAPRVAEDVSMRFSVVANDSNKFYSETITVIIKANVAPVLNDIVTKTVNEKTSVSLKASATDSDENDLVSYRWVQTGGTEVTLLNSKSSGVQFTAPSVTADENLTFTVYVTDGMLEVEETVTVTVKNVVETDNSGESSSDKDSGGSGGSMGWILGLLTVLFASRRKALN